MESFTIPRLASLAHPQRLAIFRLLVRRFPDAVPAGEIATVLDLRPSTLSAYLANLLSARLVGQTRAGTSLLYRADTDGIAAFTEDLFIDCCGGRPDLCPTLPTPRPIGDVTMSDRYNVLFICTGNSARSIFAETLMRSQYGDRFAVHSAGTRPQSELNPFAVDLLRAKGHDVSALRAKHVSEFQGEGAPTLDFVFTVCNLAANEECPSWDGQPIRAHWGMPDPVKAEGTHAEKSLAFQQAYGALKHRIEAFA
ncbi:MAG: helix-turn-helix domain-containing protein, partial [Pseudomonadota bacterium]